MRPLPLCLASQVSELATKRHAFLLPEGRHQACQRDEVYEGGKTKRHMPAAKFSSLPARKQCQEIRGEIGRRCCRQKRKMKEGERLQA